LRLGLAVASGWKVFADNFGISLRGDGLSLAELDRCVRELRQPEWWSDRSNLAALLDRMPSYRVSKFQHLLPVEAQYEITAAMLLDLGAALRWLNERPGLSVGHFPAIEEVR